MKDLKILQLNAWTGRIKDGLTRFISEGDYDIVCLQEAVWSDDTTGFIEHYVDSVDKIKTLAGFPYDFRVANRGITALNEGVKVEEGMAILSKVPFLKVEEIKLLGEYEITSSLSDVKSTLDNHRYAAQKVVLENGLTLFNYHGYWQNNPIGNETTVECMHKVAEAIKAVNDEPVILCGDLNVSKESPAMRELDFLQDLTATHNVKTTLRNLRFVKDVACDHILINDKINYKNFEVIDGFASDHKALTVTIDF